MVIVCAPRSTGAGPPTTGPGPSSRGAQAARAPPSTTTNQDPDPKPRRAPIRIVIFPRHAPRRARTSPIWYPKAESCQALLRGPPRQPGDERDEPNETEIFGRKPVVFAADADQLLVAVILADRDDQDAAGSERVNEGRRNFRSRGSHEPPLIWRLFGPALRAIADSAPHISQAQLPTPPAPLAQQFAVTFDRKHTSAEGCQNCGLVTGTCSDLDNVLPCSEGELLGHQRHDIGLAHRLRIADRQGHVLIRLVLERRGHKFLSRGLFDGAEHPRVTDPGATQLHQETQLFLDQARLDLAGSASRHPKTFFSEASTGKLVRLR